MPRRPDRFGFGTTLPSTVARVVDAAAEIMGEPEPGGLAFLHSVLAQTFLPYRDPKTRDYMRENGRASMVLTAGYLLDPTTRKPVLQGVPYGTKPRLLLIHLCTQAIRLQTPVIPIADSMSAFMRDLGLHVTGGKHGTVGRFQDQLHRLAAARVQLMFDAGDTGTLINPDPLIRRFDAWFPNDPRQRVLWPSEVHLSQAFFDSLQNHAQPLDPRAIRGLQHSARALDAYIWLANRLPRVKRSTGDRVSWAALQGQFGGDMRDPKKFRRDFLKAMRQAVAVYPKAKVEQVDGGLLLKTSPPPIRRKELSTGVS